MSVRYIARQRPCFACQYDSLTLWFSLPPDHLPSCYIIVSFLFPSHSVLMPLWVPPPSCWAIQIHNVCFCYDSITTLEMNPRGISIGRDFWSIPSGSCYTEAGCISRPPSEPVWFYLSPWCPLPTGLRHFLLTVIPTFEKAEQKLGGVPHHWLPFH